MGRVEIRDLKQNASAIIRRVKSGETLDVTERGEPVARLVPAGGARRPDRSCYGLAAPTKSGSDDSDTRLTTEPVCGAWIIIPPPT